MRMSDVPTPSTEERCATSIRESHEGPVLMAINAERRKQGVEPLSKLTVCVKIADHLSKCFSLSFFPGPSRQALARDVIEGATCRCQS